jgi:hypothetical protein
MNRRRLGKTWAVVALGALLIFGRPVEVAAGDKPNKGKNQTPNLDNPLPAQQFVQVLVPQVVNVPGYGPTIQYVPVLVPQSSRPVQMLPNGRPKGNNGVGNGIDPQPPGNPPVNDGPGTGPGRPGIRGGKPAGMGR